MEDHLDKETSASVEVTATGVKASARSRLVAAIDRLGGNIFEKWNAPMEAETALIRAEAASNIKLIEAVTELGIEKLRSDPELAARAIEARLGVIVRRQENKDAVVTVALEDLRAHPPSEEEASVGGEKLDPDFLNRFERHAEDASSETLRAKWGKVLAAEVRKPGTFSPKVMRVVDELEATTAVLFERLCEHRLAEIVPKCLAWELLFHEQIALEISGLIIDPGPHAQGQKRVFKQVTANDGMNRAGFAGGDLV